MKKAVIIYLPNGVTQQYSTVDLHDTNWRPVTNITFDTEALSVTITEVEEDKTRSYNTYRGMPFQIESWD